MRRVLTVAVLLLAGCAAVSSPPDLTPDQQRGLAEVQNFVATAAKAYGISKPLIHVQEGGTTMASYRDGVIRLRPSGLTSRYRDEIVAHEFGHYVHNHVSARSVYNWDPRLETEADVEAVVILQKVRGFTEEQALRRTWQRMDSARRAERGTAPGHRTICVEIAALLSAYPAQRTWTEQLECSPWRTAR